MFAHENSLCYNNGGERKSSGYLKSTPPLVHNTISCYRSISEGACTSSLIVLKTLYIEGVSI